MLAVVRRHARASSPLYSVRTALGRHLNVSMFCDENKDRDSADVGERAAEKNLSGFGVSVVVKCAHKRFPTATAPAREKCFAPATHATTTIATTIIDAGTCSCSSAAASISPKNGCKSCN